MAGWQHDMKWLTVIAQMHKAMGHHILSPLK